MNRPTIALVLGVFICVGCAADKVGLTHAPIQFLPGCCVGLGTNDEVYARMRYKIGDKSEDWNIRVDVSRKGDYLVTQSVIIRTGGSDEFRSPSCEEQETIKRVLDGASRSDVFDSYELCEQWCRMDLRMYVSSKLADIGCNERRDALFSNEVQKINFTFQLIADYTKDMPHSMGSSSVNRLSKRILTLLNEGRVRDPVIKAEASDIF